MIKYQILCVLAGSSGEGRTYRKCDLVRALPLFSPPHMKERTRGHFPKFTKNMYMLQGNSKDVGRRVPETGIRMDQRNRGGGRETEKGRLTKFRREKEKGLKRRLFLSGKRGQVASEGRRKGGEEGKKERKWNENFACQWPSQGEEEFTMPLCFIMQDVVRVLYFCRNPCFTCPCCTGGIRTLFLPVHNKGS